MTHNMLTPVDVTQIEWQRYGILYDLTGAGTTGNTNASSGEGWSDVDTDRPLLDTLSYIGMTTSSGMPFDCSEVERHQHTQEAQIPAGKPICLLVAPPSDEPPSQKDLTAITIRPGYVFVLHRSVWHSASHGVEPDTSYYWMANVFENEPTVWAAIKDGPVRVG
ncbi:ureidoglycolate lyase [Olsenella sp. Marseille-QA0557]|uniref:Ureidoglycolate hydrolase n=1 Tax=Candidatus Coprovicinus avistercoris TaxID=2840754 RepID=A0A9D1HZX6_9ACTN|nr:hypothetical protein [Candidatus Coprovicinus avistercoris]